MIDIDNMIKVAMKNGEKNKVNAYRNLKSKILLVKTAKNAKEYNDVVEIGIINKYVKELTDDAKLYQEKGRNDLADTYLDEAGVLSTLLPKTPTEEEIRGFVGSYIEDEYQSQSIDKSKMGLVIKATKKEYPTADGKLVSQVVMQFIK